jgi:hypothetical protein
MKQKRKKRKGGGMKKGSAFEREICVQLSKWWSRGERDDIFWRTSGSGARATQRGKKRTFGQYGDVQATDPIGQPLLNCCTIEIKRGYSHESFANIIETSEMVKAKPPMFYTFISQARLEADNAGTKYWLLISKRDRRTAIVTIPYSLYQGLLIRRGREWRFDRARLDWVISGKRTSVIIVRLSDFLGFFTPDDFKRL